MASSTFLRLSTSVALFLALLSPELANAQSATKTFPDVPLIAKTSFTYPSGIPYKVDTDVGLVRGTQKGYNICNSTTENQQSLCQTSMLNSLDDFCLWAPPEKGKDVGSIEGEMVAWCTKPGRGQRLIPHDALKGVQFMKAPDYVQVVGFIDQTKINMLPGDSGGEMDPGGADLRGNPLGGILFSNAFGSAKNSFQQVVHWHNFMGSDTFCLKACDTTKPNAAHFCEHIYDRMGCAYNVPNNAQNGTFESCEGGNQDYPGEYVQGGVTRTYTQPPESLGPIVSIPYTARIPASSNCIKQQSAELYKALATVKAEGETATPTGSASRTGSAAGGTSRTSGASSAANTNTGGASRMAYSGVSAFLGVAIAAIFMA